MRFLLSILIFSLPGWGVIAQTDNTSDFLNEISKKDVSDLWTLDSMFIEDGSTLIDRAEPLGFIGDNFQRFHIHFSSVIQNLTNPLEYYVYGKTKVKENICSFQGVITITETGTYSDADIWDIERGFIIGNYEFYEDPDEKGSGILKGKFQTDFYLDEAGEIRYDALMFSSDGYSNNQFRGTWTSYKTGEPKKCNWGDYRIPDSRGLDIGAGEFGPDLKYAEYGWENYQNAYFYSSDKPSVKEAREKEKEKWWLDK